MKQYVVDAFTDKVFGGNPAAVCILDEWIPEHLMLSIAKENCLSETAFAVKEGAGYRLRWFTPGGEIDLCGHATLATAYVILRDYDKEAGQVVFSTQSGRLTVTQKDDLYELDFPAYSLRRTAVTPAMEEALGAAPAEVYLGRDLLCVFDSEQTLRALNPDMEKVKQLDGLLLQATARGGEFDCVSRTFAPKLNVTEDPVCGSGHCHIIPYWAEKLGKNRLTAFQASPRGGVLYCRLEKDRVVMGGRAALYSIAEVFV